MLEAHSRPLLPAKRKCSDSSNSAVKEARVQVGLGASQAVGGTEASQAHTAPTGFLPRARLGDRQSFIHLPTRRAAPRESSDSAAQAAFPVPHMTPSWVFSRAQPTTWKAGLTVSHLADQRLMEAQPCELTRPGSRCWNWAFGLPLSWCYIHETRIPPLEPGFGYKAHPGGSESNFLQVQTCFLSQSWAAAQD